VFLPTFPFAVGFFRTVFQQNFHNLLGCEGLAVGNCFPVGQQEQGVTLRNKLQFVKQRKPFRAPLPIDVLALGVFYMVYCFRQNL